MPIVTSEWYSDRRLIRDKASHDETRLKVLRLLQSSQKVVGFRKCFRGTTVCVVNPAHRR
jgi:hypothetical protein